MTQKLFSVKIIYNAVVVAEDYDDAYFQAEDTQGESVYLVDPEVIVNAEITSAEELGDWYDAIPINGKQMTCNEILKSNNHVKKDEIIENLSNEQKKRILSQMTLEEILTLLGNND